jgi:flagella basal body P-ring formation protein FlgA
MKPLTFFLTLCSAAAAGECVRVDHQLVLATDLAGTVPAFAQADPGLVIAFAPSPGVTRLLSAASLSLAARKGQIPDAEIPVEGVCVQRSVRTITEQEFRAAMIAALHDEGVELGVVDYSRYAAPNGPLTFPLTGLDAPPRAASDSPVLWRGHVSYDRTSTMQVWARVRVSVLRPVCVAAETIAPGTPIARAQVTLTQRRVFPFRPVASPVDPDRVAGMTARKTIPAGQEIAANDLIVPLDVRAGDTVQVTVVSGNAVIRLDAIASSGGRKGDAIVLRNPATHASFRAVVDGNDRAVIRARKSERS